MTTDMAEQEFDIPADVEPSRHIATYLGRVEVAAYIGLKSVRSLSGMTLPPHDAEIGSTHKGWTPETIDAWQASRPGRGRWGARG